MFKQIKAWKAELEQLVDRYAGDEANTVHGAMAAKTQVKKASLTMLWAIAAFFVLMFIWIAVAEVDTVTRADGRVIPSAKLQVIQNLEGGIVGEILVKPGQHVEKGEHLVLLSGVQHDSEVQTRSQQIWALEARSARLNALAYGGDPKFPMTDDKSAKLLVDIERAGFLSKKAEQAAQISVVQSQLFQKEREQEEMKISLDAATKGLELALEERKTVAMLVERGLEPRLELVRLDRSVADLQGRAAAAAVAQNRIKSAISEVQSRKIAMERQFRSEALAELNKTQADLNALQQSMPALADKLARTEIKAPMKGVVNRVFVSTVGGVVKPGEPIIEVVPADDELVVEALVRPQDIGFVKLGQSARVKVTAYDYSIFGAMDGTVVNVSADAVPNEKGEAFYQVRVETKTKAIEALNKQLSIIPGMQCQVDIVTGSKTILQFLSKPIVGVKENAFRER